ncbi:MAG: phosphotransferase [Acidobacteriota bacterium]|nr:phosphotransferase [Acidobacteriota bacterium]
MFELNAENAVAYLMKRGLAGSGALATELGGGVSNTVLRVHAGAAQTILKQSLGRLRVKEEWLSDRRRILRESAAMRLLAPRFPAGSIPRVIFEDPENCLFAMTAAAPEADTWKTLLFSGIQRPETAARAGSLLATLISSTWKDPACEADFGDQTVFRQLRIDPYYRAAAARHPDLRENFERLIDESGRRRVSLVHGDWSPKNLLVAGDHVTIIDFEVIHFGDPSFDTAFLLNHLLLKSLYLPERQTAFAQLASRFWESLAAGLPPQTEWMERATIAHLGCLLLARVDGKSPAEYLETDELKERVRRMARELILNPPGSVEEVFAI